MIFHDGSVQGETRMAERQSPTGITFIVSGPIDVPVDRDRRVDDIAFRDILAGSAVGKAGCYIFARRTGRGVVPLYVGRSWSSIGRQCIQQRTLRALEHDIQENRGTLVLFLLTLDRQGRGATNKKAISRLETWLIEQAIGMNTDLLNKQGTRRSEPPLRIPGILNSGQGRPSEAARALEKALGLHENR